jgi:hypothetical protein
MVPTIALTCPPLTLPTRALAGNDQPPACQFLPAIYPADIQQPNTLTTTRKVAVSSKVRCLGRFHSRRLLLSENSEGPVSLTDHTLVTHHTFAVAHILFLRIILLTPGQTSQQHPPSSSVFPIPLVHSLLRRHCAYPSSKVQAKQVDSLAR